jgi:hypothetical protein
MKWKLVRIQRWLIVGGAAVILSACGTMQSANRDKNDTREYTITVQNTLAKERFASLLIVGDADDSKIWVGPYVSSEAHTQFTTGNPAALAAKLGGEQAQPGRIPVGETLTFKFHTKARTARITAMVHPDFTPDNYVTALISLDKPGVTPLERFDIGDDEKRKTVVKVGPAGSVTLK